MGSSLYLTVDEKEGFREDDLLNVQESFPKNKKILDNGLASSRNGLQGNGKDGRVGGGKGAEGGRGNEGGGSDIYKGVEGNMEAIVVLFGRSTMGSMPRPRTLDYAKRESKARTK
jgi:hypothetical protein